mmetsp:Transcript_10441/g.30137  ORF Transcript_10441/g.30137 Transcript_10441/m.30137 type:complete len:121 (+) Transcript_10441:1542-1904(+)
MNGTEEGGREERHQGSKRRMRHKLASYLPDDTSPAKDEHEAAGEEESPRSHAFTLHSASEAERLEQLLRQYVDWDERISVWGCSCIERRPFWATVGLMLVLAAMIAYSIADDLMQAYKKS